MKLGTVVANPRLHHYSVYYPESKRTQRRNQLAHLPVLFSARGPECSIAAQQKSSDTKDRKGSTGLALWFEAQAQNWDVHPASMYLVFIVSCLCPRIIISKKKKKPSKRWLCLLLPSILSLCVREMLANLFGFILGRRRVSESTESI